MTINVKCVCFMIVLVIPRDKNRYKRLSEFFFAFLTPHSELIVNCSFQIIR